MMTNKPGEKENDADRGQQDFLDIARLVSWCLNRDYLIKTCLDHISQRLGKRACCVLIGGGEPRLRCRGSGYECSTAQFPDCKEDSVIKRVVENGVPVNLKDNETKINAIIPLWYVDSLSQEEKRIGALIVDSSKAGDPISAEDFEYLKVVGELIGGAIGKVELAEQAIESYRRKEAMVRETAHAFRNRITAIGTFSQQIARLSHSTDLARKARMLYQEVLELEAHLGRFEKYIGT